MSTILGKFSKQPQEILDYDVDFSKWFSNRTDSPVSFTTVVEAGITLVNATLSGNVVKIVLSGGTSGQQYKITVRLTTALGLVKEADFVVKIKEV